MFYANNSNVKPFIKLIVACFFVVWLVLFCDWLKRWWKRCVSDFPVLGFNLRKCGAFFII